MFRAFVTTSSTISIVRLADGADGARYILARIVELTATSTAVDPLLLAYWLAIAYIVARIEVIR